MTGGIERWVHLYEFRLRAEPDSAWPLLSPDEHRRAVTIRDPVRRARFAGRRAALREILSGYTGRPAAAVNPAASGVCFSCSHSADVVAIAVALRPVGVDVEIERRRAVDRIARRMFAADELSVMNAVDGDVRAHLFHRCWVAKEAYAKGLGRGLVMRFDAFSVSPALCAATERGPVLDQWGVGPRWTVSLDTFGDRHLAVAAPGDDWIVERRPAPSPDVEVVLG